MECSSSPMSGSLIDTGTICFICLRDTAADTESGACDSEPSQNFHFRSLSTYLKIKVDKEPNSSSETLPSKCARKKGRRSEKVIKLCGECLKEGRGFSKLYQELIQTKMRISAKLGKIHEIMKQSQQDESRMRRYRQVMIPTDIDGDRAEAETGTTTSMEFVETLRQELLTKCEAKSRENQPKVVLPRMIKLSSKEASMMATRKPLREESLLLDPKSNQVDPEDLTETNMETLETSNSTIVLDTLKIEEEALTMPPDIAEISSTFEDQHSSEVNVYESPPVASIIPDDETELHWESQPAPLPVITSVRGYNPDVPLIGDSQTQAKQAPFPVYNRTNLGLETMESHVQILPVTPGTRTHFIFIKKPTSLEVVVVKTNEENVAHSMSNNQLIPAPPKPPEEFIPPPVTEVDTLKCLPEMDYSNVEKEDTWTSEIIDCKYCSVSYRQDLQMRHHVLAFHSDVLLASYKEPSLTLVQFRFAVERLMDNLTFGKFFEKTFPKKKGGPEAYKCFKCPTSMSRNKPALWRHMIHKHFECVAIALQTYQKENMPMLQNYRNDPELERSLFAESYVKTGSRKSKSGRAYNCNYLCKICERTFTCTGFHGKVHGFGMIKCTYCAEAFNQKRSLDLHVAEVHCDRVFFASNMCCLPKNQFISKVDQVFEEILHCKRDFMKKNKCPLCPQFEFKFYHETISRRYWRHHMILKHKQFMAKKIWDAVSVENISTVKLLPSTTPTASSEPETHSMEVDPSPVLIGVEGSRDVNTVSESESYDKLHAMEIDTEM